MDPDPNVTLVRCVLVEVCTVPVLLLTIWVCND